MDHAERFSLLLHGAALLYNLMLSERVAGTAEAGEKVAHDRGRLADWTVEMAATPMAGRDLDDLWAACNAAGYRVTPQTMRFVAEWRARAGPGIADDPAARAAVERREMQLKGATCRFRNAAALTGANLEVFATLAGPSRALGTIEEIFAPERLGRFTHPFLPHDPAETPEEAAAEVRLDAARRALAAASLALRCEAEEGDSLRLALSTEPGADLARDVHVAVWPPVPGEPARNDREGCGTIMRVGRVAFALGGRTGPEQVAALAAETWALTHAHPTGQEAAAAGALILRAGLAGEAPEAAARDLLGRFGTQTDRALRAALAAPRDGRAQTVQTLGGGWVAEEALALHAVHAGEGPEARLCVAATHSGDTGSAAAIAGNLAGLQEPQATMPRPWRAQVECADPIDRLARDLVAGRDSRMPLDPAWGEPPVSPSYRPI